MSNLLVRIQHSHSQALILSHFPDKLSNRERSNDEIWSHLLNILIFNQNSAFRAATSNSGIRNQLITPRGAVFKIFYNF